MNLDIYQVAFGYVGQTVFLFVALWIMLKLQKLNFKLPGLILAAMVASALDHVPYVGIPLSVIVLVVCITKLIGSRTFTDAIFTTGIAYAISFCFNLFVLGSLMGDLRHVVEVRARTKGGTPTNNATMLAGTNPAAGHQKTVTTFLLQQALASVFKLGPSPETAKAAATNDSGASVKIETSTVSATNRAQAGQRASDVATNFKIKGFSRGVQTIAVIGNGRNTYDVAPGDNFKMQTAAGKADVACVSVDESKVVLEVEGVEVTLRHRDPQ